ncbi:hypothetical protein [Collimonas humicola]|uniref:hypothetical protein n=1 Tax=Collimonas humicola TaxID=2825886 RepID=UPI001B8B11A6|nr:hypothetical protein [Collimonas humicola]
MSLSFVWQLTHRYPQDIANFSLCLLTIFSQFKIEINSFHGAYVRQIIKTRLLAFIVHLGVSALLGGAIFSLIYFVWFPSPYFLLTSGRELFLLLLECDVVLGPLLTLVIFDISKPQRELRRDLMIIACIQLLALGYGLHVIFQVRPMYVVFNGDQFNVVAANEVTKDPKFGGARSLSIRMLLGPEIMGAILPDNEDERQIILRSSIGGGPDLSGMPKYFVPYDQIKGTVKKKALSARDFAEQNKITAMNLTRIESDYKQRQDPVGFVPVVVQSRFRYAAGVVSLASGELLQVASVETK